jgi:hypothetical protein
VNALLYVILVEFYMLLQMNFMKFLGFHFTTTSQAQKAIIHCFKDRVLSLVAEENETLLLSLNSAEAARASISWLKRIAGFTFKGDSKVQSLSWSI